MLSPPLRRRLDLGAWRFCKSLSRLRVSLRFEAERAISNCAALIQEA